ncbi:proteasome regulatory particle base subunit [Yamadazyma tenuis]|uniref:26S proteasome regulatory subunit RPN2 n=1 Tax=Candida tenuis (strain ATCC 10573 / BCRC 21748 / CBS 615 / JCM 9827 / NBRC 10315 / NRRL Y-1498 / VKM Y-70) TaxID=590646 RepID=G3BCI6_CANTC|nr:26S proteasome regulatory complex, non-ATPase subcomplex, Rpn2/Psmd1 subunit [Yamadazyma tenuis ATCC 10573]EGV60172.1 26S proteasome regulatory complex, non-ATPase subcomplex, Rpn2/Psmd1 subunit [Yamadazyma tenuis ATCC 10573]WEJ94590.1 proteasome regulatory particle base subunit [Yamadazyma tenuis]
MALVSAAPYLALLNEQDSSLKAYALTSLNDVVDQLWAEIANNITDLEELYEDESFEKRSLAALIISKVYYNLGDFDSSVKYSLAAGDEFDIDEQSQYIETIVSQCINLYTSLAQKKFENESVVIDKQLTAIFERMLLKCIKANDFKLALGISLESLRLDIVEKILHEQIETHPENAMNLINYILVCSSNVISNVKFRKVVLESCLSLLLSLKNHQDYFTVFKIIVQLNDFEVATQLFKQMFDNGRIAIAYQGAFDLVSSASQELLDNVSASLKADETFKSSKPLQSTLLHILSGVPTCDLDITFLHKNNNTDKTILNKTKNSLEGRSSIFHSAVTFANAFIHAGTTDDSFIRKNLEWLGKATNWSKFSATAALGVIHKGNLTQGRNILKPYLPGSSNSPHSKGGSLFALGLIFAGHGKETIEYLKSFIDEHGISAGNSDNDVMLHGACLGCGVAGMASNNESLYEAVKSVLYLDSAVSGQAAGLAMGLIMLGSGNESAILDMMTYAEETQHENIIRGLAIGVTLLNYGREAEADKYIKELMGKENFMLRYGGVFTIALAYAGTGNNKAIQQLLHVAVSDPSDDVRRAAVMCLGFVLIRDYTAAPQIVELLSQSYNPHVRYGTAMALGISCAGRALPAAIEVLEPLTKDPVDFVRQGALMATSMILIQQNEHSYPKVKEFHKQLAATISNKHEDALAKFGATLAQGIIHAGGRNVTINLENSQTNTLNMKAIVGLSVFLQSWYWFPFAHFLSLSFTPTAVIGIRGKDLKIPKFELNCHTKPKFFEYPPKVEESKEKQPDKVATAVLSTTARANARAKKQTKKEGEKEEPLDKMEVDESKLEVKDIEETKSEDTEDKREETVRYSKTPYKIENLSRVLPAQANYTSFLKDSRFVPVRKSRGVSGIIVLNDTQPHKRCEFIKTVRQLNVTEAPVPEPFILSGEDLEDEDEDF